MIAHWLYLASAALFMVATILNMQAIKYEDEDEPDDPWGVNQVRDGGTVDGGNYDGWEDDE